MSESMIGLKQYIYEKFTTKWYKEIIKNEVKKNESFFDYLTNQIFNKNCNLFLFTKLKTTPYRVRWVNHFTFKWKLTHDHSGIYFPDQTIDELYKWFKVNVIGKTWEELQKEVDSDGH